MSERPLDWLLSKWSPSKVGSFARCPRQFFYKYVQRMKDPLNWPILFGRAVHAAMETDAYAKLRRERLPLAHLLEAGVEEARHAAEAADLPARTDEVADGLGRQLEVFEARGERARILPVAGSVEAAFQVNLLVPDRDGKPTVPVLIEGFTDVVSFTEDGTGKVAVDYKSNARPLSTAEAATKGQLVLEAIGSGADAGRVVNFVRSGKQKETVKATADFPLTQAAKDRTLLYMGETIAEAQSALKSGDFPKCDPTSFTCNHGGNCPFGQFCFPREFELSKFVSVASIVPVGSLPRADWRQSTAGKKEFKS